MTGDVIASIVTGVLIVVGLAGIIVPVLPGSVAIIVGLLIWAIVIGGPTGWIIFAIGTALCLAGVSATYVLTGRRLKAHQIPNYTVAIALIVGVVGMFVIPVVGLLVGFVLGLYLMEWWRIRDPKKAWQSSWVAIKATGVGLLLEFGLGSLAAFTWVVGLFIHFR